MLFIRNKFIMKSCFRYSHIYIDHYNLSSSGISLNEFHQRRQSLVNLIRNYIKIEQTPTNFTICLPASSRLFMGPDVAYFPFKQQSDFYYFTGCMQPDAFFLLNEQNLIRHACQLTSNAFIQTIKNCKKTIENEYLIQARFQYECARSENSSMAFYPVIAANGRSNILHYQKNDQSIDKDDLIMLDGGCLFKQYAGDVTRFWPMNGRFSSTQRQLYEILLTVQKDLIKYLNSGDKTISRSKLNILADQYMIKYLREESILSRSIDDLHAKTIVNYLCPTSASHHLGLDVHDCEAIPFSQILQPGNVITIEPGLYIPWDCKDIPSIYRGFATRIEDDILITEQGCEILTDTCPKEINDLYQLLDERDRTDVQ
ncbi:hypothetical protein I4U23_014265 [Adineta vaga]|nr:hypothetical protein I4U23_014265 [Adineta vaga]